jgi:uncharacterized iron-regulated membrane protein
MKILLRKIHKWLGLLMVAQILAWMVSGFYFSIIPISEIRGEHLTRAATPVSRAGLQAVPAMSDINRALDEHFSEVWDMTSLSAINAPSGVAWRVEGMAGDQPFRRLIDAQSMKVLPQLDSGAAAKRAGAWLVEPSRPASVEWIEADSGVVEFRGRDQAAWRAVFDRPESLRLYLDPWTGEILARRTSRWRLFDFLWMLHIMDYDTRDDFNHPLLQIAALAGLLVALSGLVYWFLVNGTRRRRRADSAP